MHPFYFGDSGKQLFGAYHPPASSPRGVAVLLCPPLHGEYIQSHRAMRALARLLAEAGLPVLRFDYYGTGDSAGRSEETSLRQCYDDIATASRELMDTSGVTRVILVGLRLGGALAAAVATRIDGVRSLVLWDPVINGANYLDTLASRYQNFLKSRRHTTKLVTQSGQRYGGYPVSDQLRNELKSLNLLNVDARPAERAFLVCSEGSSSYDELILCLRRITVDVEYELVPVQKVWEAKMLDSNELVPTAMLQRIVSWIVQR